MSRFRPSTQQHPDAEISALAKKLRSKVADIEATLYDGDHHESWAKKLRDDGWTVEPPANRTRPAW